MNSGSVEISSSRERLLRSLRSEGILKTKGIEEALRKIHREDFLWSGDHATLAYLDEPVPLGETGQTISAPHMVVIMLEALDLYSGMKVLEIGTGSGYNAALIAQIVSDEVKEAMEPLVITVERDEKLVEFASRNIARVGLEKVVKVVHADGTLGYPERSETIAYDRIIVTAATPRVPYYLLKQLKANGIVIAPVGNLSFQTLTKIRRTLKQEDGKEREILEKEKLIECMFVPLIGEQGYRF